MSTITTTYGSWTTAIDGYHVSIKDSVAGALGDSAADFDIDAIISEYRAAINEALDELDVVLCGDEFLGPWPRVDTPDLAEIVESVDFWAIVQRHDTTGA